MDYARHLRKLFWKYLFFITVPIILIGGITVGYLFEWLARDAEQLNLSVIRHTMEILDTSFNNAVQLSFKLRQNALVQQATTLDRDGKSIESIEIWELLKELRELNSHSASRAIDAAGIYLPSNNIITETTELNTTARYFFEEYYNEFLKGSGKSAQWWSDKLKTANNRAFLTGSTNAKGEKILIYCALISTPPNYGNGVVIVIRMKADVLMNKLFFALEDENIAFAIQSHEGETVFKTENFTADISGEPDYVVMSEALKLKYVFEFLKGGIRGNVHVFAQVFIVLLFSSFALSGILAIIGVRKMQHPILKMHGENERLNNDLNELIENARDHVVVNYLLNEQTSEKWVEDLVTRHSIGISGTQFRAAAVSAPFESINKLVEVFIKNISHEHISCRCVALAGGYVFVIGYDGNPNIHSILESAADKTYMESGVEFNIGVGLEMKDLSQVWKSYETAVAALRDARESESGVAIYDEHSREKEKMRIQYSKEQEAALIWNVKNGPDEKIEDILNKIYTANFVERQLPNTSLKKLSARLTLTLYDIIGETYADGSEEAEKFERVCRNILQSNDVHDSFYIIKETFYSLRKTYKDMDEMDNIRNRIIRYIEENYMNHDLSLDSMASLMNMNYSYFSRHFKKLIGVSFMNYLIMRRMEKAKEFLEDTEMTVKQVAEKVGFTDGNTFSRTYKKYYGVTPRNRSGK